MKRKKAVALWILNTVFWVSIFIGWLHHALKFILRNEISPKNANVLDWSQLTWFTVWREQRKIHRVISVDGLRIKAQLLGSKKEPARSRPISATQRQDRHMDTGRSHQWLLFREVWSALQRQEMGIGMYSEERRHWVLFVGVEVRLRSVLPKIHMLKAWPWCDELLGAGGLWEHRLHLWGNLLRIHNWWR